MRQSSVEQAVKDTALVEPEQQLNVSRCRLRRCASCASPEWKATPAKQRNGSQPIILSEHAELVLEAALEVRSNVDERALSLTFAKRPRDEAAFGEQEDAPAVKEQRKKDADSKAALLEALRWTCEARLALALNTTTTVKDTDAPEEAAVPEEAAPVRALAESMAELDSWVDTSAKSGAFCDCRLRARLAQLRHRPAQALATVSDWLHSKQAKLAPNADLEAAAQLRAELYDQLGWDIWATAERNKLLKDVPNLNRAL